MFFFLRVKKTFAQCHSISIFVWWGYWTQRLQNRARRTENYKFHRYDMEQQRSPRFVLSVGGSFNPIHMSHVRLLCEAKNALLSLFGPECVHKGALAVAHQNHVVAKLGAQDAIKAGHRLNMSNAVAREHGNEWLVETNKCYSYSLVALGDLFDQKDFIFVDVLGGDNAQVQRASPPGSCCIFIGREGYNHKKEQFERRTIPEKFKGRGIFSRMQPSQAGMLLSENDMYLYGSEDDVSSTKVRTIMENVKSNNPKEGLEKLKGLLEQVVIDYMEENWKDLFQQTK